jgi:MFS family permease
MTPGENDPLWRLRHALAGVALALLLAVLLAAVLGSVLGDVVTGSYGGRVAFYSGLLLYVVAGAVALFIKVAQYETRPLSLKRTGLWLISLWIWPALLVRRGPRDTPKA